MTRLRSIREWVTLLRKLTRWPGLVLRAVALLSLFPLAALVYLDGLIAAKVVGFYFWWYQAVDDLVSDGYRFMADFA